MEQTKKLNNDNQVNVPSHVQISPFNMRNVSLENFPPNDRKTISRVTAINRFREDYLITCPYKSIILLRKLLQTNFNNELNKIFEKYSKLFLEPVFTNIAKNMENNKTSYELNMNAFMHLLLDEAKKMFPVGESVFFDKIKETECKNLDKQRSSNCQPASRPRGRPKMNRIKLKANAKRKRNLACLDKNTNKKAKNKHLKQTSNHHNEDKWNPSRLTTKTLFVLGSKANKALGFGSARGRLYSKHSDLFRYIGDHEDKEWLHKNQLMPPTGGKAYLLVKDDIIELINSNKYKDTPGVNIEDMGDGFTVPQSMIEKISNSMRNMKNLKANKIDNKLKGQQQQFICDTSVEEQSNQSHISVTIDDNRNGMGEMADVDYHNFS